MYTTVAVLYIHNLNPHCMLRCLKIVFLKTIFIFAAPSSAVRRRQGARRYDETGSKVDQGRCQVVHQKVQHRRLGRGKSEEAFQERFHL